MVLKYLLENFGKDRFNFKTIEREEERIVKIVLIPWHLCGQRLVHAGSACM